jgi:SRSO17 transposase
MKPRFKTRKREIEEDAKVDKKDLAGALRRLDGFLKPFFESLPRSESRGNATMLVKGLLSDIKRKNIEAIAYRFERDRRALQRFIGESVWDHQLILDRIARQAAKPYGEEDGVLAFDPSGFEKDGKMSAGVARQYLGRFGKVDNGQVGTFLAYVTRKEHVLVNAKLFIPQEWNDDPERCRRAKIPQSEYETHKTRHEHCLEMLDEQGDLLPHRRITGDDELGKSSRFRWSLRNREERYVLAVPCNTNVRDLNDVPEYSGHGPHPKGKFGRVDHWKERLATKDWTEFDIRDGEKKTLKMKVAIGRVMAHTEIGKDGSGDEEWSIVVERPEGSGVKYDYYLSNADDATPVDELARVVLASHRIEDCFRRAKDVCGLAEYEVRTWPGWHHHVTLSLLATFFLTKETLRSKKKVRR